MGITMQTSTKLILLVSLLVLSSCMSPSDAAINVAVGSPPTAGASPCATAGCDGTYKFCWTGDYAADTDKACFTSGGATKDGTQTGTVEIEAAYGRSGNGIRINDDTESWSWVIASDDGADDSAGTLWMSVYIGDVAAETTVFETNSGTAANGLRLSIAASERTTGTYKGNNAADNVQSPATTGVIDQGEWTRVMYSWDQPNDTEKVCVDKDTGGDKDAGECDDDVGEGMTAFAAAHTELHIGEDANGVVTTDAIYIDDVKILSTYDAADPNPL
jgi:hypothetical protein